MRWLLAATLLSGCLVRNPKACDAQHSDCGIGQMCVDFKCVPIDSGDGGDDLAVGDLGELDGPPFDGADLARVCDTSDQCLDPNLPVCTAAGQCRSCVAGEEAQCATHAGLHVCEVDAGRCAQCSPTTQATICTTAQKPFCGSDGTCRGCQKDSECGSDVCLSDGSCAAVGDVFYVDNGGQPVATCNASGTHNGLARATAWCDIQDAITPNTRKLLKVYGYLGFTYNQVSITAGDWTIIGPGVGVAQPAIIFSTSSSIPAVQLVSSGNASLTLIGIEVGSRTAISTKNAVVCTNNGAGTVTLTMRNSAAQHTGEYGVQSANCKLILDGNRIAFNTLGGVNVSQATKYTITNNFIYRNSSTAVFIDASIPATGTFQFNTIAHNTKASGSGGIDCGSATQLIESSIFWMNSPADFIGSCVFVNSDVGTVDPGFVNETGDDYRITTSNAAIVDKVTATVDGGGPLPDHDFFGTHRPLGNGWDVGAHEKQ